MTTQTTPEEDYKFVDSGFYSVYPIITHEEFHRAMKYNLGTWKYYRWIVRWFIIDVLVSLKLMKRPFTLGDIQ